VLYFTSGRPVKPRIAQKVFLTDNHKENTNDSSQTGEVLYLGIIFARTITRIKLTRFSDFGSSFGKYEHKTRKAT